MPLLKPYSEEWYAQSSESALSHYDYVAVEAMPFMEESGDAAAWLRELVQRADKCRDGLKKTVFELQTVDWRSHRDIPMATLLDQMNRIKRFGAVRIGYYPDNVFRDHPRLEDMERVFAAPRFP